MHNYTLTNFHQIKKLKKNPNILSQIDIKKKKKNYILHFLL